MTISAAPASEHLGARIEGVDMSRVPDAATVSALENLLEQHGVLVFPDQHMTPAQQVAFTRAFGPLLRSPRLDGRVPDQPDVFIVGNVGVAPITFSPAQPDGELEWHTDQIHRAIPARASLLYARIVPAQGGDTLFACTRAPFEALPLSEQTRYEGMQAIHSPAGLRSFLAREGGSGDDDALYDAEDSEMHWPLVRRHPLTGRKAFYFGSHVTVGIEGLDRKAAADVVRTLTDLVTQPRYIYRHRWHANEAVLWDNRRVLHTGTYYDVQRHHRLMHRTMLRETAAVV